MKQRIFFLAGLLTQLFSLSVFAQKNIDTNLKDDKSLLWKISGKDLKKPSYLFGTIHLICNNDYFFNDNMQKAFDASEELVLEINLSDPATIMQYQQGMMLQDGKQLKNFFSSENEFNDFSKKLKSQTGIDASLFQTLKPLILLSLIAQKSFACENTSSYEMNLIGMAEKNNIPVAGLETSLAQMKIFDDMKDEEVKKILVSGLEDAENDNKIQNEMIAAYKKQDVNELHRIILSSKEFENQEDALINNRNKDWAEKLPAMMKEKSCFIAVGSGHLGGEKGVINLLREKGYEVVPLRN